MKNLLRSTKSFKFLLWISLMLPLCANSQFVNGDFNAPGAGGACNAGTGWTYSTGSGTEPQYTNLFMSNAANYWIDLTPCWAFGNGTWIAQDVPTVIGQCYTISLDVGSFCGWDMSDAGMNIFINGSQLGPRLFVDTFDCNSGPLVWKNLSSPVFIATTNPTNVKIVGEGHCSNSSPTSGIYACVPLGGMGNPGVMGLDNVSLNPGGVAVAANLLGTDTAWCDNFSYILDATTPGATYLWSTGATDAVITISSPGIYWVSVTGSCGSGGDTVIIQQELSPILNLGLDTFICQNDLLMLNAAFQDCSYQWSTGSTASSITVSTGGLYWVNIANACGIVSDSIKVSLYDDVYVQLPGDTIICDFSSFSLDALTNAVSVLWSTGESTNEISIHHTGTYWVTATNPCSIAVDSINIIECIGNYIVPSAFSPNGDGINDGIFPIKLGDASLELFEIFNRWGQMVYSTITQNKPWDGTYQQVDEELGVYVYLMKFRQNKTGKEIQLTGNITLLR